MNTFPSSSFCWQTMQTFTCYSHLWQAAYKPEIALWVFPTSAVMNEVCCCGSIKKRVNCMFLIPNKTRDTRSRIEWFMRQKHQSIPKIKGRIKYWGPLNTFNQLQKPHRYYFPLLKKKKERKNTNPKTKYKLRKYKRYVLILQWWILRQLFNRNASVAQKCPYMHHLPLACKFTSLVSK